MDGNARTGMEDTLMLRRGVPVDSNAELVARLAELAGIVGREVASVEEAARLLRVSTSV
jgi:3-keto-5-aminohexanoate cleavage enzyme